MILRRHGKERLLLKNLWFRPLVSLLSSHPSHSSINFTPNNQASLFSEVVPAGQTEATIPKDPRIWVSSRVQWVGVTSLETSHRISGTGLLSISPSRGEISPQGTIMPLRLLKFSLNSQTVQMRIMVVQVVLEDIPWHQGARIPIRFRLGVLS